MFEHFSICSLINKRQVYLKLKLKYVSLLLKFRKLDTKFIVNKLTGYFAICKQNFSESLN